MPLLTKTELITQFKQSLDDKIQYTSNETPAFKITSKYTLYPIERLSSLQQTLQNSGVDDPRFAKYIVTLKKQLLLGRAGEPGGGVADHHGMYADPLLTAGYIFFNEQGDVTAISNESRDVMNLSMSSMIWAVLALSLTQTPMAESFCLISTDGEISLSRTDRISITNTLPLSLGRSILKANQITPTQLPIARVRRESFFPVITFNQLPSSQEYEEGRQPTIEAF